MTEQRLPLPQASAPVGMACYACRWWNPVGVVVQCRDAEHQQQVLPVLQAAGETTGKALTFTEKLRLEVGKA